MKRTKLPLKVAAVLMAGIFLFASCSSTTLIQSVPSGAKVYIDGQPAGNTPYRYSDTKIVGTATDIKLEMEGYEPYKTVLVRNEQVDVGAIIGGLLVWVPFLWTMGYNSTHTYELEPFQNTDNQQYIINDQQVNNSQNTAVTPEKTLTEKLQELKSLLEQNLITQEDYNKAKAKLLGE